MRWEGPTGCHLTVCIQTPRVLVVTTFMTVPRWDDVTSQDTHWTELVLQRLHLILKMLCLFY